MENNQTDFMKNRPVAAQANQYKDVYGSQSRSARTTISAVMTVVVFVLMLISIFTANNLMMLMFIPLFILLVISFFVARRADRQNTPVKPVDDTEAIFKEHDI